MAAVFGEHDESPRSDDMVDPIENEIKAATLRSRLDVVGRIVSIDRTVRPIRFLDVLVDDGTGQLRCRFFARDAIPGITEGGWVRIRGRLTLHLGRDCICNPDYELRDPPATTGVASS
jgi:OB-fold nucleic acid binding domain